MRKLKYHVASTVDGFIAREDGSSDCFMQDRLVKDSEHVADYLGSFPGYGTVLMGRGTYEVGLKAGVTDPYPAMETYVFSRTLTQSPAPRVKLIAEDAAPVVRQLKQQQGKDIYLCGGGRLASALFAAGLVDEVLIKLNPLLLGAGIPLSPGLRDVTNLELLSTKVYKSGVLLLRYTVIPPPQP